MKIHPTAIIGDKAKLADSVEIGPYSIVADTVSIGEGTSIGAHCVIDGITSIGSNCEIFSSAIIGSIPQDLKFNGENSRLEIGNNNKIRECVTINTGTHGGGGKTVIGNDNLLMAYVHIAHDCVVGNNCVIANVGTLGGHVTIEDRVIIGGLVAIHQFSRVGKMSIIGGCSKVVQDVPPFSTCDGHPASVCTVNVEGLRRANIDQPVRSKIRKAFKIIFFSGLSISTACKKVEEEIEETPEISYLLDFIRNSKRGISK